MSLIINGSIKTFGQFLAEHQIRKQR